MKPNKKGKAALFFIFITVLIDVIGLGIIIPVVPSLIIDLTGQTIINAAEYGGLLMFIYAGTQFLFAPMIGALSDRFGRRPLLLCSLCAYGLNYLLLAWAPTMTWLFFARFLSGITGATTTTASAYVADISAPEEKAQNFGLLGAAFGLGFIIGPVIGGLLGEFGSRLPFIAAAVLSLINFIYGYFILPESLASQKRRSFELNRANPFGALKIISNFSAAGLFLVFFLIYLSHHATQSTWTYYTMFKFGWDEAMVGISLGIVGICVAVVQGGLTRWCIPKMGLTNAVYLGIGAYIIGFLGFSWAPNGKIMLAMIMPYALGGFAGPSLQGILSNQVPANMQGELQGVLTSLISFSAIIGPPVMTQSFSYFSTSGALYIPGAPFILGALLSIVALIIGVKTLGQVVQKNVEIS
ncbi:MAG: TCR/Tet family MFS transporter [Bacteroidota bacterium]|nr:TCR/Tet family MFS transporter [Bacteroidota bacterium]